MKCRRYICFWLNCYVVLLLTMIIQLLLELVHFLNAIRIVIAVNSTFSRPNVSEGAIDNEVAYNSF